MLSPEYYSHLSDDLIKLYSDLDNAIISDIVRRIVKNGEMTETAKWQAKQLQESGMVYDDVIAEIAKRTNSTQDQVRTLFEKSGVESVKNDNVVYKAAGLEGIVRLSPAAMQTLNAGYVKCSGDLSNLTLTTANTAQQAYITACNNAYMQISSGAFDYNTAIRNAVKAAAVEGTEVLYPSGHRDKLDVAVRRSVLTGVGQTCRQLSLINAQDMGCDLMEITAHSTARPSHAEWQGQLVSLSGRKGYLSLKDIGYGTGDGFGGWNCRHDWYPFFEGISVRNYSDERLREMNAKNIEYNGKKYTEYEISQIQRKFERDIRSLKRKAVAYDTARSNAPDDVLRQRFSDDFAAVSVKLKNKEHQLGDFLEKTGQLSDNARTQVLGFGRSVSQKAVWAEKKSKISSDLSKAIDKNGKHGIINENRFSRTQSALPNDYVLVLKNKYNSGTDIAKKVYDKFIPDGGAAADIYWKGTAHHSGRDHQIYLDVAKDMVNMRGAGTTWFHEHGHYVDCDNNYISRSESFLNALRNDVKAYEKRCKKENGFFTVKNARDKIADEFCTSFHLTHSIQDIYGGVYKKRYRSDLYGHRAEYWKAHGDYGVCLEAFAHMFEASFTPEKQKMMQKYLPTAWEKFKDMLGEII